MTTNIINESTTDSNVRSAWSDMSRDHAPHPAMWHTWLATAWTGMGGLLVDRMSADWQLEHHLLFAGAVTAVGTIVGSAAPDITDRHQRGLSIESGVFGTVTGAAMGAWGWVAAQHDLASHVFQPDLWGGLLVGGVLWGGLYTSLRLRITRSRAGGRSYRRRFLRTHGPEYVQVMEASDFGRCKVIDVKQGFQGFTERAIIELDPQRHDTPKQVVGSSERIAGNVVKIFRSVRGVELPNDPVRVSELPESAARVAIDVTLRPVTASLTPDMGDDITTPETDPEVPLTLGAYLASGDPLLQNEAGPHGISVGESGSGKSTYMRAQIVGYNRRPHVVLLAAGISKFVDFLAPFMKAVAERKVKRGPFAMIGGGPNGSENELMAAVKTIQTAVMVMRMRDGDPDIPRDDGRNVIPSADHPRIILYIDELDSVIMRAKNGNQHRSFPMPDGTSATIPQMLTEISTKGRSLAVEKETGTQRITDTFLGYPVRNDLTNVRRRALFRTTSGSDVAAINKNGVNPMKLPENAFYFTQSAKADLQPAKVIYYPTSELTRGMIAAEANGTLGDITGREAAALGDLWSGRWSPERFGPIARSLGITHLVDGDPGSIPDTPDEPAPPAVPVSKGGRNPEIDALLARVNAKTSPERSTILHQVRDIIGDRDGATQDEIIETLGWVTSTSDKPARDAAKSQLRGMISDAIGHDVKPRQKRGPGGDRDRYWMAADLKDET